MHGIGRTEDFTMTAPQDSRTPQETPAVAFVGAAHALELAYPETLRRRIDGKVRVLKPDIHTENWRQHRASLEEADIILATWGMPVMGPEFLSFAPKVKAVFYAAGTVKPFATPEAFSRGIVMSSAWSANAIPVAQYAAAAAVLSLKGFWKYAALTRNARRWSRDIEVPGGYSSVVGLISLGAIGRRTAGILSSFGLRIVAYDPHVSAESAAEAGATLDTLQNIFRTADVISIHAPSLPETEGMIDGSLLRLMKPGATLINTSRGSLVNEEDLCSVMVERPDLTAILDVTHPEPPDPNSPLFRLENVILTPHIAGSMGGEISRMGDWMLDELAAYLEGSPLKHQIEPGKIARMA